MWSRNTTLVLLLAVWPTFTYAINFNRSEPIHWIETPYKVDTGLTLNIINYQVYNPCQIIKESMQSNLNKVEYGNWTTNTIDRLADLCEEDLKNIWKPQFEKFANCTQEATGIVRKKRFVWFLIGTIAVIQCVSSICATKVAIDKTIDNIRYNIDEAQTSSRSLLHNLQTQQQINGNVTLTLSSIHNRTASMVGGMDLYSRKAPEAMWSSVKAYEAIKHASNLLEDLAYDCSVHGRVNTRALSKLTDRVEFRDIRPEDTHGLTVNSIGPNKLEITFLSPSTSKDAHIYAVKTFPLATNLTSEPVVLKYTGPEFVIHNTTANCTKGIEQPRVLRISEVCMQENYSDPRLLSWTKTNMSVDALDAQVISKRGTVHVFCLSNHINFGDKNITCPAWPFALPSLTTFRAGDIAHTAQVLRYNTSKEITPNKFFHFNASIQEEDLESQFQLIKRVHHLSQQLNKVTNEGLWNIYPEQFSLLKYVAIMPSLAVLIWAVVYLVGCMNPKRDVTVINSPPAIAADTHSVDSFYPPVKKSVSFGSTVSIN